MKFKDLIDKYKWDDVYSTFMQPILEEKEQKRQIVLVEESQDLKINQGHYFEFMDRTSVALDYLSVFRLPSVDEKGGGLFIFFS